MIDLYGNITYTDNELDARRESRIKQSVNITDLIVVMANLVNSLAFGDKVDSAATDKLAKMWDIINTEYTTYDEEAKQNNLLKMVLDCERAHTRLDKIPFDPNTTDDNGDKMYTKQQVIDDSGERKIARSTISKAKKVVKDLVKKRKGAGS